MNKAGTKEQCPNCNIEDNTNKLIKVIYCRAGMFVDCYKFKCMKCEHKWEERRNG